MKISIVVPGRWHAFDLAATLNKEKCLHKLITSYPKSRTRKWNIPDDKVVSLPLQLVLTKLAWKVGGETLAMRFQYIINNLFAKSAARYISGSNLVHAWSGAAEPSLLKAKQLNIPTVLERSSAHMEEQCRILREEYAKLGLVWTETPHNTVARELREYKLADCIAVPSLFVEQSFLARGFRANQLNRNGFGVSLANFTPIEKNENTFRVIFAGSLSVRKGVGYLAKAFKSAALPESELLLVGGHSPETSKLLGDPSSSIKLIGHRPQAELVRFYQQSSVFVMPSVEEGQAMVQFQALACGVPLICTENTGGEDLLSLGGTAKGLFSGLIREYPAGYVVKPQDPDAIAQCLNILYHSPDILAQKRNAALELRNRDISWDRYAKVNIEMYRRLVASRMS